MASQQWEDSYAANIFGAAAAFKIQASVFLMPCRADLHTNWVTQTLLIRRMTSACETVLLL